MLLKGVILRWSLKKRFGLQTFNYLYTYFKVKNPASKMKNLLFLFTILLTSMNASAQTNKTGGGIFYNHYKSKNSRTLTDFAVKGDLESIKHNTSIHYKYSNQNWHYIRCTPSDLTELCESQVVTQIYFTPSYPSMLNDSSIVKQHIDSIHNGYAPLIDSFTGKGIIIGYVDTGIDFTHGDFKNDDGSTRVLRYWDHTLGFDVSRTPTKYGYGQVWTNSDIDNGICTSTDNHAHGTTVSGCGSGNANENGKFKGMAPDSDIIIVETDLNMANWTLSVADAVDYIFTVADSLNKPAVVNTSVGDYLGSHDGRDPAAQIVDSLLNDKPGRIVVAAAGNAGNVGKIHVKGNSINSDTNFTWFEVNNSSAFGNPAVYFDLWADTADFKNVFFAMGADNAANNFDFRGRTQFYNIQNIMGMQEDSIMNSGNKISPVEFYAEEINGLYHLEVLLDNPDSTAYLYRFMTYGVGTYDAWGGSALGISNIKSTGLPSTGTLPEIVNYQMPDTLCTIVSSWSCSPNVITVGNYNNKLDYIDVNGNTYTFNHTPGDLSINSSKGPTRDGMQKPDVVATGDGSLSACPNFLSAANPTSNSLADGGKHIRNGGTSMASPVIAGIAALYLEKCPNATYADFKNDLLNSTFDDNFTGATPNFAFGYGKVNAFKLLTQTNFDVTLLGDTLICENPVEFITLENNFSGYEWSTEETSNAINVNQTDTIFVTVENNRGCKAISDSILVIKGTMPIQPTINILGGGLVTTPADHYIWYFNGDTIAGENEQFINPDTSGVYAVEAFSPEGCSLTSDTISINLSTITELKQNEFVVFPNPFTNSFQIIKNDYYLVELMITDIHGKLVYEYIQFDSTDLFISVDLPNLESGMYFLTLKYDNSFKTFKLIKN